MPSAFPERGFAMHSCTLSNQEEDSDGESRVVVIEQTMRARLRQFVIRTSDTHDFYISNPFTTTIEEERSS